MSRIFNTEGKMCSDNADPMSFGIRSWSVVCIYLWEVVFLDLILHRYIANSGVTD